VAAHLERDVLSVDEVLAVGDAEFQKKCFGKMDDVAKKEGRTVLFVSHNMAAVTSLCTRVVRLASGRIGSMGPTSEVVNGYLVSSSEEHFGTTLSERTDREGSGKLRFTDITLLDAALKPARVVRSGDELVLALAF